MNKKNSPAFIVYVPVLHQGYNQFFGQFPEVKSIFLINRDDYLQFDDLRKDVRCLSVDLVKRSLSAWGRFEKIEVLDPEKAEQLRILSSQLILPDDDFSHWLVKQFFSDNPVSFAPIFLRWNKYNVGQENDPTPDNQISASEFNQKIMLLAYDQANKSADWWRHVGAVLMKDQQVVFTEHNQHLPSEQQPYFDSDPRNLSHKGQNIELSTAIHAEAKIIAEAAKKGFSTLNSEMYVTTFPCPLCAKQIASAGVKRVYYSEGYGMLHAQDIFKTAGIELIKVNLTSNQIENIKNHEKSFVVDRLTTK